MSVHVAGPVRSVTEQNLTERVLEAERSVLIQFWAAWCRPCKMVTPIVESLAADQYLASALREAGADR
ncbi:thioredoxin family protein [Nonomuraea sp. NPDC001831]|uniref:thioredoxin family protein n=1 Tax=Nonomuraea sp. NPDC001831 TaxID=3364340 RepID=UPI003680104A